MVTVEPCSVKGCQGMSIDGLDGRCDSCLEPEMKNYVVTGTITRIIEAMNEEDAVEHFENVDFPLTEFDDIEVDEDV